MISETGYWDSKYAKEHHIHSPRLSQWICDFLKDYKDNQIYDFGCGMANYLSDLKSENFTKLLGIEPDFSNFQFNVPVMSHDLTIPIDLKEKGIVICLEVGEHIPANYCESFLLNIKDNCEKYLILSWAIRGQGGSGHFNELNNDEVIPMFEKMGFKYLETDSNKGRVVVEDFCSYFRNTIMIFEK